MIRITEISPCRKMTGKSSFLINFDFNQKIVDTLKTIPTYYYHKSDYLEVMKVTKGNDGSAVIEVKVNNASVENVAFQINGTYLVFTGVRDGVATVNVPATELLTDSLNIVEVKAMDADKNYIVNEKYSQKGNYNLIHSNYSVFE